MAWLPLYLAGADVDIVHGHLDDDPDLAWLVATVPAAGWRGPACRTRWSATGSGTCRLGRFRSSAGPGNRIVGRGPLAGLGRAASRGESHDALLRGGASGRVLAERRHVTGLPGGEDVRQASFEWIGNHYRMLGHGAASSTEAHWKASRRWVAKLGRRIAPPGGATRANPGYHALPSAYAALTSGPVAGPSTGP